jgi:hypothetical protein
MQAGAASKAIADDPDTATAALRAVQDCGRATVLELRRVLVLMRASPSREMPLKFHSDPQRHDHPDLPNHGDGREAEPPPSTPA